MALINFSKHPTVFTEGWKSELWTGLTVLLIVQSYKYYSISMFGFSNFV